MQMNGKRNGETFTLKAKKGVRSPFLFNTAYLYAASDKFPGQYESDTGVRQAEPFDVATVHVGERVYVVTSRQVEDKFVWETR